MITLRLLNVAIIVLLFLHIDCKHSTEPPPPPTVHDTTSHDFVWTRYVMGGIGGSSGLKGVTIINENDIWVVGKIDEPSDTVPPPTSPFNAAHWNGTKWEPKKIAVNYLGNLIAPTLEGGFAFSTADIWFVGSLPIHGDGNNWTIYDVRAITQSQVSLSTPWGTGWSGMYFVGRGGSIASFNGATWKAMLSGTTVDLIDVWGSSDGKTVWACGSSIDNNHSILLKFENGQWKTLWTRDGASDASPFGFNAGSVWQSSKTYLATTNGIFTITGDTIQTKLLQSISRYTNRIRGNNDNDFSGAGVEGLIWHYNGATIREYFATTSLELLFSCDMKGNTIVAVGSDFTNVLARALIYVGKRQ